MQHAPRNVRGMVEKIMLSKKAKPLSEEHNKEEADL